MDFLVPHNIAAAVEMKSAGHRVLAGGTDFYPQHVGRPLTRPLIDISGLDVLRGIQILDDHIRIGALTRWSDVVAAPLPRAFDALRAAAREVGSVQVQNAGTVGGNLCNASPAADGIPPLLALDASVEMTSAAGTRVLPLDEFLTGYRETALRHDELVTAVLVQRGIDDAPSAFLKLGLRRYLVISVVMVAAVVRTGEGGRIEEARIAVGACSPVAQRLRELEAELAGRSVADALDPLLVAGHLEVALTPIDDVRGTAAYRRHAAAVLVARALSACGAAA